MGRWLSRISGESAAALPLADLPPAQTTQRYGSEPVSLLTVRLPGYARDMLVSKRPPHRVLAVLSVPQVKGADEIEAPRLQGADVPGVPDVPQDDRGDTALPRVDRPYRLPPSQADAAHLDPWTPEEIARFQGRAARFVRLGLNAQDAEDLAETLHLRDITADHRHMCIECQNLKGWRCGQPDAAQLHDARVGKGLVTTAQCCPAFTLARRT